MQAQADVTKYGEVHNSAAAPTKLASSTQFGNLVALLRRQLSQGTGIVEVGELVLAVMSAVGICEED